MGCGCGSHARCRDQHHINLPIIYRLGDRRGPGIKAGRKVGGARGIRIRNPYQFNPRMRLKIRGMNFTNKATPQQKR